MKTFREFTENVITSTDFEKMINSCKTLNPNSTLEKFLRLSPKLEKDFSVIDCNGENHSIHNESLYTNKIDSNHLLGFHELNGHPIYGFVAYGDWEAPVYHVVYFDGTYLRGFIPVEGNFFNTDTKCPYGNDYKKDIKNLFVRHKEFLKNKFNEFYGSEKEFSVKSLLDDDTIEDFMCEVITDDLNLNFERIRNEILFKVKAVK